MKRTFVCTDMEDRKEEKKRRRRRVEGRGEERGQEGTEKVKERLHSSASDTTEYKHLRVQLLNSTLSHPLRWQAFFLAVSTSRRNRNWANETSLNHYDSAFTLTIAAGMDSCPNLEFTNHLHIHRAVNYTSKLFEWTVEVFREKSANSWLPCRFVMNAVCMQHKEWGDWN